MSNIVKKFLHKFFGHKFSTSKLIYKIRIMGHKFTDDEHTFTLNLMECECGSYFIDSGVELNDDARDELKGKGNDT